MLLKQNSNHKSKFKKSKLVRSLDMIWSVLSSSNQYRSAPWRRLEALDHSATEYENLSTRKYALKDLVDMFVCL